MTITAAYSGNTAFAASTASARVTVNEASAAGTAILTASPTAGMVGMPETVTLTISPMPTGSSLGTVSFYNGSTLLGTANVNSNGTATLLG